MKKLILPALVFCFQFASAQVATWAEDVAPIIYGNCSSCHNVQGIAPFELMSYADAVQNATEIKDQVVSKLMPPWPPDPEFSRLAHERILTQQQIAAISDWVDNGTPRGDTTLEPPAPVINNSVEITSPDLVIQAPVFPVNTTVDLYRCFVVPSGLSTEQYLTGLEAIPGNRNVVHHILIYSDTTNLPVLLDALDPGPGYTSFGGTGSNNSKLIGVWVPGQSAFFTPAGMGIRLPANTNIILQIHYPGGIVGETDSTKLHLKLTSTFQREIDIEAPLNHFQLDNGPLFIPANTTKTFYAHYFVPTPVSVLAVGPHMHLIGKSIMCYGVTLAQDTIPFIDIPEWDFHWQGLYAFPHVMKVPFGTTIYSEAYYDNTTANDENPNNPPQDISLGEATTDEMMLIYFAYTGYQTGDENIVIDSTMTDVFEIQSSIIATPQLFDPTPNPVSETMTFQYFLPARTDARITLTDITGKLIRQENVTSTKGLVTTRMNVQALPSGIYLLNLEAGGVNRSKKVVVE